MIMAGTLNRRIAVYRLVETPDDMGGMRTVKRLMSARFANIAVPRARDAIVADQEMDLRTHVVTVRDLPAPPEQGDIIEAGGGLRLRVLATRPDIDNACVYCDCESVLK